MLGHVTGYRCMFCWGNYGHYEVVNDGAVDEKYGFVATHAVMPISLVKLSTHWKRNKNAPTLKRP